MSGKEGGKLEALAEYLARAQASFLSFGAKSKILDGQRVERAGKEGENKVHLLKYEKLERRGRGRKFWPEITARQRKFRGSDWLIFLYFSYLHTLPWVYN